MKRIFLLIALFVGCASAFGQITNPALPNVVASTGNTTYSSTSTIAATTLLTPANSGIFMLCYALRQTVAGSAGTWQGFFQYTDATVAHTAVSIGTAIGATTTGGNVNITTQQCPVFHADANTNIQYGITAASVTGTPTIQYSFTLIQLQ